MCPLAVEVANDALIILKHYSSHNVCMSGASCRKWPPNTNDGLKFIAGC